MDLVLPFRKEHKKEETKMPNWCNTSMTIEGPKAEIESIHRKIKEWTSRNYVENDFGKNWLGNIVVGAGFSYKLLACRGLISFMDEEITARQDEPGIYYFQVQYESAWTDINGTWETILEKYAPNCEIYYVAEELGNEYFVTNDRDKKYYDDEIIVVSYLEQSNPLYQKWNAEFGETEYITRQVLKERLTKIFGQMSLRKLIKKAEAISQTDDEYVYINQVQYV